MIRLAALTLVATAALTAGASADSFVFALGGAEAPSGVSSDPAVLTAEYHFDPFMNRDRFALGVGVGAQVTDDSDVWVGGGLVATYELSDRWQFEASLMPGFYDQGSGGVDLGHDIEFRTLIGVNYRVNDSTLVGLAIDHKSNAGLDSVNPGIDTISVRLKTAF